MGVEQRREKPDVDVGARPEDEPLYSGSGS